MALVRFSDRDKAAMKFMVAIFREWNKDNGDWYWTDGIVRDAGHLAYRLADGLIEAKGVEK